METFCIKRQIQFLRKIRKIFKYVVCWKVYAACYALTHKLYRSSWVSRFVLWQLSILSPWQRHWHHQFTFKICANTFYEVRYYFMNSVSWPWSCYVCIPSFTLRVVLISLYSFRFCLNFPQEFFTFLVWNISGWFKHRCFGSAERSGPNWSLV